MKKVTKSHTLVKKIHKNWQTSVKKTKICEKKSHKNWQTIVKKTQNFEKNDKKSQTSKRNSQKVINESKKDTNMWKKVTKRG